MTKIKEVTITKEMQAIEIVEETAGWIVKIVIIKDRIEEKPTDEVVKEKNIKEENQIGEVVKKVTRKNRRKKCR